MATYRVESSARRPRGHYHRNVSEPAITYASYLRLTDLLAAQRPQSDEHDELLFITIHQVYELWFQQTLHELARAQQLLEAGESAAVAHTLRRVLTILKVSVAQIDVLETMTPRQFAGFRNRLDQASGFQSAQFRQIEAVMGRRESSVLDSYPEEDQSVRAIEAAMRRPSLFHSFVRYLGTQGYDVESTLAGLDVTEPPHRHAGLDRPLLAVYADDGAAAQIAERFVDLDEGIQEWRYRHVKMVERTIGDKSGTGGSSGAAYLRSTLFRPFFPDLWAIRASF